MAGKPADTFSVRCRCGAKLRLPVSGVGRQAKCPKCQAAFRIPDPSKFAPPRPKPSTEDAGILGLADEPDGGKPCPHCGKAMAPEDIICMGCGYNVTTKRRHGAEPDNAELGPPLTCPCCNTKLQPGAKICVDCGVNAKTGRSILITGGVDIDDAYVRTENVLSVLTWIIWSGVYPFASEAFGTRRPYFTWAILATTVAISVWFWVAKVSTTDPREMKSLVELMHWSGKAPSEQHARALAYYWDTEGAGVPEYRPHQLITSAFLHADIFHLAGNMLFLLVLGGRVNAAIGNLGTSLFYVLFAVTSALISAAGNAHSEWLPSLGASGAVMGMAGMYLVLFPIHKLHMAGWWRWGLFGGFELHLKLFAVRGFWAVLFYIAFDVFWLIMGAHTGVGHWAHVGGFLSGAAVAILLLVSRLVSCGGTDLLSMVLGRWAWPLVGRPNKSPHGLPLP